MAGPLLNIGTFRRQLVASGGEIFRRFLTASRPGSPFIIISERSRSWDRKERLDVCALAGQSFRPLYGL
jgi:hypothetical protein